MSIKAELNPMTKIFSFSSVPALLLAAVVGPVDSQIETNAPPEQHSMTSKPPTAEQLDCAIVSVDLITFQKCLADLKR